LKECVVSVFHSVVALSVNEYTITVTKTQYFVILDFNFNYKCHFHRLCAYVDKEPENLSADTTSNGKSEQEQARETSTFSEPVHITVKPQFCRAPPPQSQRLAL